MCCAGSLASNFHVPPQDKLIIVQAELDCSFNRNLYCDANMYFYVKVSFFPVWHRQFVKKMMLTLPYACQSHSPSPYFDLSLFRYDDKVRSTQY